MEAGAFKRLEQAIDRTTAAGTVVATEAQRQYLLDTNCIPNQYVLCHNTATTVKLRARLQVGLEETVSKNRSLNDLEKLSLSLLTMNPVFKASACGSHLVRLEPRPCSWIGGREKTC